MKDLLNYIFTFIIGFVVGVACIGSYFSHDYSMSTEKPQSTVYIYYTNETNEIVENEEETFYLDLTEEEQDLLMQIAMSEARSEGVKGMALVMNVVLNRAEKDGTSIKETIYKPGAFYTEGMMPGNAEAAEALALVMEKYDESQGALYFASGGWNKYGKIHLFQYGSHYFSK